MRTESQIREDGFEWENIQRAFLWQELGCDLMRELVEYDTIYKTQLQHHLLCAFHGYATYPSFFYKNMYIYLRCGLAEERDLEYYTDKVYQMYSQKFEEEMNAMKPVYKFVDSNGRILDQVVF